MSEGTGGELAQIFHDMGQHCEIKRVDKNKKVIGEAKPEEFEQEVNRAQRMGTVAGGLKGLSRAEKMQWALDVKDQANEFYRERRFKEAATAYQDCLLGLDFGSNEEQANESKMKLQLPIVLNLAACFLEQGAYFQAAEVSKLATEVDPTHPKGWFRRGLAHWRLENAYDAKPHFEQAVKLIEQRFWRPQEQKRHEPLQHDRQSLTTHGITSRNLNRRPANKGMNWCNNVIKQSNHQTNIIQTIRTEPHGTSHPNDKLLATVASH